jgi:hypothetical protein
MSVLSPEYDGVEKEIFYILDIGVGWKMEPLSVLSFSGLHFHGGCRSTYRTDRADRDYIYYRLTLIAYPPELTLSGRASVAFASLPGEPSDKQQRLLPVGFDFRRP